MVGTRHGALGGDADEADEAPADSRRGARQAALQALYWAATTDDEPRHVADQLGARFAHSPAVRAFCGTLVEAVVAHQDQLDVLIRNSGTRWSPDRMARVDLLILRLALAEILHLPDVPVRVSIDEAVELAKLYSTGESYAFVNGVLDAIVQRQGLSGT
jgi:transcription antitermination protein NusB